MSDFENVLQECLQDLEQGAVNVEDCLRRFPKHAAELEPVLLTSVYFARGREARLSSAFETRVRARLLQEMRAHPRKTARPSFLFLRLTASLTVMMFALLAAGTVYAQRALPGESFYAWKLTSENLWRMVYPDPVEADLVIAERRLAELIAVQNDPVLQAQMLAAYLQVTDRLRALAAVANETRILAVLDTQAEQLSQLGILPEELPLEESAPNVVPTNAVPTLEVPTLAPANTPLPSVETPQVNPTELPEIVPTVEILPEIIPTIQDPLKVLPTIEILPPIP